MLEKLKETCSVWSYLKTVQKPVVLYGMGNGADMILSVLEKIGVRVQAVFASDGFVRGHFFHGFRVLRYTELCERYDDFIILMTFAVHDRETLERIRAMSREHELLSPTVPIAGSGLFTPDYIAQHEAAFEQSFHLLADEKSREAFLSVLNFKVSGKIDYLFSCQTEKSEVYSDILHLGKEEIIADLGAYDGDTVREFLSFTGGHYRHIYALEPDEKNYRKLCAKTADMENISLFRLGAWDKEQTLYFEKKAGRNSRAADAQTAVKTVPVPFNALDNVIKDEITFLKMDIEGAEEKALNGAQRIIRTCKPKLYICAYHRNEDAFALPLKVKALHGDYRIYYRHHPYIPAWESNFYCI